MTEQLPVLDELERRLVTACYATPARHRRRWPWAAAGVATTVGACVLLLLVIGSGSVATPAALALDRAAAAVEHAPAPPPLGPGQYWYTRTIFSSRAPLPIVPMRIPSGQTPGLPPLVTVLNRQSDETWIGLDGTLRDRTIELSTWFASAAGRARWLAAKQPPPNLSSTDSITGGDGWFPPQSAGGPGIPATAFSAIGS